MIVDGVEYLTSNEVLQYYQNPNAIGLVKMMRTEYDVCGWSNGVFGPFEFEDSHITDAVFWNLQGQTNIGDHFELNAEPIKPYADKKVYSSIGGGHDAPINFGGELNRFQFVNNSSFPGFKDSITFQSALHITSLNLLDTVHSNQDLTINWTGGATTGKIQIMLNVSKFKDDYIPNGETTGIKFYIEPTASHTITIPRQMLQTLNTSVAIGGYYDISLSTAEPKSIVTPNNKVITVLGVSRHTVAVVLKH